MARKKPNPKQVPMFDEACLHHGPENVCPLCPGHLSTDGFGFVHPRDAAGRIPVRRCRQCELYRTRENWSTTEYFICKDCATALNREKGTP